MITIRAFIGIDFNSITYVKFSPILVNSITMFKSEQVQNKRVYIKFPNIALQKKHEP